LLQREAPLLAGGTTTRDVSAAASALLRFGLPFTASSLAGAGIQYVLPILVLRMAGVQSAGFYAAAAMIAVGYAGFFLNVLAQDYYPRVAAVRDRPADLVRLINAQHRVLMIAGMPVVLGLIALAHIVVPLIYSREFAPAVEVLEWQLTGDLLRFSSWVMSFVILARNGSATFLLTETLGGFTLLTASWFGLRWFGLPGIGMAFLVSSVVHNTVVTWIVRRDITLVWSSDNLRMIVAGFSAALIIRCTAVAGFSTLKTVVALAMFTAAVVNSVRLAHAELTTATPDGLVSSTDSRLR
jgi:O-antigen/teichoic acid export membrane protein